MVTDPVQLLIDAGAIPVTPFGPSSRYANVAIGRHRLSPSDPGVAYVRRRFLPRLGDVAIAAYHTVRQGDRLDVLAAHYLGDPELHWRVADANPVSDMLALTSTPGDRIAVPLPPGSAGA
jgi:hypothetical protein